MRVDFLYPSNNSVNDICWAWENDGIGITCNKLLFGTDRLINLTCLQQVVITSDCENFFPMSCRETAFAGPTETYSLDAVGLPVSQLVGLFSLTLLVLGLFCIIINTNLDFSRFNENKTKE